MDTNDAPLSEFDSEQEEDEVVELGDASEETRGGITGWFPEGGGGRYFWPPGG